MIDLHCHYLPFLDDGAQSVTEAVTLSVVSYNSGITHAVLTPHLYAGRWDNPESVTRGPFEAFHKLLKASAIPLELRLAAEVHLLPEALEMARRNELPTLGHWRGDRVVLLELPDGHVPAGAEKAAEFLMSLGYRPMIAHPERNKDVMRDVRRFKPFVDMGCLAQVTAASVTGAFGEPAAKCAAQLIDAGAVTVLATDAHNMAHRPPLLREAREAVLARWGEEAAERLTRTHAGQIIGILPEDPVPADADGEAGNGTAGEGVATPRDAAVTSTATA